MQTFVDLHGAAIKETFVRAENRGLIEIRDILPTNSAKYVSVTKYNDKDYLMFDQNQMSEIATVLNWKNHVQFNSNKKDYSVRIRPRLGNQTCNLANKDKCTLQILIYREKPLTFLNAADTIAVLSAMKIIGSGGGASASLGGAGNATHFRFSTHVRPADPHSEFFSNPTEKPGAIAVLSDRASTYQPFLHRDGGQLSVELNMNTKNVVNVGRISGITNIESAKTLEIRSENGKGLVEFKPDSLSSTADFTVTSPIFTFQSETTPDSGETPNVSIENGNLKANELKVDKLTSTNPVQFHGKAVLNEVCTGSQISFTTNGEPAYCLRVWQPFKQVLEKEVEKIKEVQKDCPPCPKPPPPPEGKRDPLLKEGTMKWVKHEAKVSFPAFASGKRKSVFFLGSEWHNCSVVVDHFHPGNSGRIYDTSDLVEIRRSKFTAATGDSSAISRLGTEVTWQMITTITPAKASTTLTYTVECYRPAIMGPDYTWYMGSLAPLEGKFANPGTTRSYGYSNYQRIQRLHLQPVQ